MISEIYALFFCSLFIVEGLMTLHSLELRFSLAKKLIYSLPSYTILFEETFFKMHKTIAKRLNLAK